MPSDSFKQTDEELMGSYAADNFESFQVLYKRYEARLFQFLRHRLPSRHQAIALDLFQSTWLKIHLARKSFDSTQKFSTWLFTIAINTLRDHLALKRHEVEEFFEHDDIGDQGSGQVEILIRKEELTAVAKSLSLLPTNQREVFLLSDWEGFDTKEIAEMLKISEGSVRQLLYRGRQFLRVHAKGVS